VRLVVDNLADEDFEGCCENASGRGRLPSMRGKVVEVD
jgi:hypothetical protein